MVTSYGWGGKILDVDLTTGKIKKEPLSKDWAVEYIGGSGFMARILYDEVGPEVDALSPENIALIGQGPLSGTLAPSAGRYDLVAKSPQTGIFARSNGGGNFGPEMRWAGYDLIIVRGKSENPVYLWIEDDHVELRDACHLWGQTIWTARRMICDELGDPDIATLLIGPAGENECLSSCVISDLSRAAGRCAIGAVWGSKKLKGVAARGSQGVNIAKPAEFLQLCKTLCQRLKEDPLYETHSKYGTMSWVGGAYSRSPAGRLIIGGEAKKGIEETDLEPYMEKNLACFGCPLHCGHFYNVKEGKYKGTKGEGIEGGLQDWGLGWKTFNPAFLLRYNNMCNQLGLNIDSPAVSINWAMNLWEAGIITKADTDGIEVTWGNEDAVLELTRKIAYKEGFGELLDDYPVKAAQRLGRGSELYASHTKGLYTWGFGPGIGTTLHFTLGLNVAIRGYDHLIGGPTIYTPDLRDEWGITHELLAKLGQERYGDPKIFTEPWTPNPKRAQVVYDAENLCAIADMTGLCKFASQWILCVAGINMQDFSELLTAATGEVFTVDDLVKAAEREFALERAYNAREGIRRIDDYPFFLRWQLQHGEPNPVFNYEQLPLNLESYDVVLDEYYRLRGCDLKTGIPIRAKLEGIDLKDVAEDLVNQKILVEQREAAQVE